MDSRVSSRMYMKSINIYRFSICALIVTLMIMCVPQLGLSREKPEISWAQEVFSVSDGGLLDDTSRWRISYEITKRLDELEKKGKLPFKLKTVSEEWNGSTYGLAPIGIIPIVVADTSFDSSYKIDGVTLYKSIILSGLDITIASADEENGGWRVLYTLPLRTYMAVGADGSRTEPVSAEEKSRIYAKITAEAVDKIMFPGKVMENIEVRSVLPDTWQVTDVKISSKAAKKLFEDDMESAKDIMGGFYTSSFQTKNDAIVYTARSSGHWQKDAERNLYALQLAGPGGTAKLFAPVPKHPVTLELYGIKSGELAAGQGKIAKNIGYKIWMRADNGESVTRTTTRQFSKVNSDAINIETKDVFMELMIGAASELGRR